MFELKSLHPDSVPAALEKAERYRLLNEPRDAESICRDVLEIDADNQDALVNLILALSDQFGDAIANQLKEAQSAAARLQSEYDQAYYAGIISERRAKAQYRRGTPLSGSVTFEWLRNAMDCYERAQQLRPDGNDDALLRWNACARMIMQHPNIKPVEETSTPLELE